MTLVMNAQLTWTFFSECPIPNELPDTLVEGERIIAAYKTSRDSAIFTNRRILFRDSHGVAGKKEELYSLPYASIQMWSSECGEAQSEVDILTKVCFIKLILDKEIDVNRLEKLIAKYSL